jgi:dipeptidyl aminopeptidase/acylaminoacyl peptidase
MRNRQVLAAVLVAACAGSPKPAPTPAPPPEPPVAPVETPSPVPPHAADATPDVPSGADAARDAELAKAATSVIDTFVNYEAAFTHDGKRVVFLSNRDGLPQLYVADAAKPASPATRLVTTTERMTGATPTRDGKALIFGSDHGADENWSLFRVDLDGKNLVELTPGAKLRRDDPQLPDGKPDVMFYSARAHADVGTSIYTAPTNAPGEERVVFKDDKPGFLLDVTRDGKWGLYVRVPSQSENYIVVVDLAKGESRPIYPKEGKVTISSAAFSTDGKRVFVGTDGGGEQAFVLAFDTASAKEVARFAATKPATVEISALKVAKQGNVVAALVNAGNHSELRLLDATSLKPKTPVTLPLGTGDANHFSDDGRRLAITWSTPSAPNDVFSVDVATGKLTPLRKEARPQLAGMPAIEASIVEVEAFDHQKIPVNVYLPAGRKDAKLPVIVSYHGGPADSSAIRWSPLVRLFLAQGYAWVEPNVRGSNGFGRAYEAADDGPKRLDAFKDIETTGKWAALQPWADKDKLVVFGGSYGGYTVLVALTRWPTLWRAGVDIFGIANLKTFMATTSGLIREIFLVEFGDPDKDAAFLDSISPLRDVDKIARPLFVYAGANDPRVPRSESDLIVKALRARTVPVEYMVKEGEGHSIARRDTQIELFSRTARFLEAHLK